MIVLVVLLIFQIVMFSVTYFFAVCEKNKQRIFPVDKNNDIPDVIITAREAIAVIIDCVKLVQKIPVNKIYLCLDNPTDRDIEEIGGLIPANCEVVCNRGIGGKINTQLLGVKKSISNTVLLLDADIRLIINDREYKNMLYHRIATGSDFLCGYSTGINLNHSNWVSIAECDRILRQRIIRAGRDYFGLSNLSGYFLLADREKYLDIAQDSLQDDVVATLNLLNKGYKTKTYHKVVCGELERLSFYKHLMQRTRWTVGNLMALPSYLNLFTHAEIFKGFVFILNLYIWYFASYIDCVSLFYCIFDFTVPFCILFITEMFIKTVIIWSVSKREKGIIAITLYNFLWPLFSTTALLFSVPYFVFKLEKASRR